MFTILWLVTQNRTIHVGRMSLTKELQRSMFDQNHAAVAQRFKRYINASLSQMKMLAVFMYLILIDHS